MDDGKRRWTAEIVSEDSIGTILRAKLPFYILILIIIMMMIFFFIYIQLFYIR